MIKIAFIGAQGTGKTTLAKALYDYYITETNKTPYFVTEVARRCPYALNEGATIETQNWILREQIYTELSPPSGTDIIICDRSTIDQYAYVLAGFSDHRINLDDVVDYQYKAAGWAGTYDRVFYCPIEFPLVDDGVRSGNAEFQRRIDEFINGLIRGQGMDRRFTAVRDVPVHLVSGSVEERLRAVVEVLRDHL